MTNSSSIPDTIFSASFRHQQLQVWPSEDTLRREHEQHILPQGATLESARILLQTTTLPLDANIQIKFYDALWNEVMMKNLGLMESGAPDASGIITTPNILNSEIALDATEALTLLNAAHIIAEATMDTYL